MAAEVAKGADEAAKKLKALSFAETVASKKPFYDKRVALFDTFKARAAAALEAARAAAAPISITLPDGTVKTGTKWVTTPLDVAAEISKGLAAAVVVAKVNDAVWDVFRPLEEDCTLKLCTFEDAEGRDVRGALALRQGH
jgi:threonyl-tRNA synthetase